MPYHDTWPLPFSISVTSITKKILHFTTRSLCNYMSTVNESNNHSLTSSENSNAIRILLMLVTTPGALSWTSSLVVFVSRLFSSWIWIVFRIQWRAIILDNGPYKHVHTCISSSQLRVTLHRCIAQGAKSSCVLMCHPTRQIKETRKKKRVEKVFVLNVMVKWHALKNGL